MNLFYIILPNFLSKKNKFILASFISVLFFLIICTCGGTAKNPPVAKKAVLSFATPFDAPSPAWIKKTNSIIEADSESDSVSDSESNKDSKKGGGCLLKFKK